MSEQTKIVYVNSYYSVYSWGYRIHVQQIGSDALLKR